MLLTLSLYHRVLLGFHHANLSDSEQQKPLEMAEIYGTFHSQELMWKNMFICVKDVALLLESNTQFSTQVNSLDDYPLTT